MNKRSLGLVAAFLVLTGAFCWAADLLLFSTGRSWVGSASVATVRVTGFTANSLSVKNTGSKRLFAGPNWATTNAFNAAVVTVTNSIALQTPPLIIEAGDTYTFEALDKARIRSFCIATTNGTTTFVIGAF